MCCAAGRSSADDDGNRRNPASRGRGRGRPTEELGDGPVLRTMAGSDVGESPSTEVTPHREDDYIGEDGEDDHRAQRRDHQVVQREVVPATGGCWPVVADAWRVTSDAE